MSQPTCYNCIYAYWDKAQWVTSLALGFPSRPICANHPDTPGQMRPVPVRGVCRNYQPRPPTPNLADGTIKQIPVGRGQYVYVDAADYERLSRRKWRLFSNGYPGRREKGKTIFMHREIMQPPAGMVVDHIDGNPANCCRRNLRICTQAENARNTAKRPGTSSRFKGVYRKRGKWLALISFHGIPIRLGSFDDEEAAAQAYDRKAVELGLEFAWLNFPHEWPPERRAQVYADARPQREALLAKAAEAKKRRESKQRKAENQKAKGQKKEAKAKGNSASAKTERRSVRKRPAQKARRSAGSVPKKPRRKEKKARSKVRNRRVGRTNGPWACGCRRIASHRGDRTTTISQHGKEMRDPVGRTFPDGKRKNS